MRSLLVASSLALGLAACSGGGGSAAGGPGGAPAGSSLPLVFDTAAGVPQVTTARFEIVALERPDGTLTGDLLPGARDVIVTHPDADSDGFELVGVPDGVFTALHVAFAPDGVRARHADGRSARVDVGVVNRRLPFRVPLTVDPGQRPVLGVRHRAPVQFRDAGGGNLAWDPDLVPDVGLFEELRFARLKVVRIDVAADTIDVEIETLADMLARLAFAPDAFLLSGTSDRPLSVAEFVAGLERGSRLVADGVLENTTLTVTAALDLGHSDPGGSHGDGRKSEVAGTILEILPDERFRMSIQQIVKGAHNLPDPNAVELVVDADDAKIKWVPRHARHRGHLPFAALEVGMRVEVEWLGPAVDGIAQAMKVDIRAAGQSDVISFEGDVVGVEPGQDRFVVEIDEHGQHGRSEHEERVVLLVSADTTFVLETENGPRIVGFTALRADDEVRVRARRNADELTALDVCIDDRD